MNPPPRHTGSRSGRAARPRRPRSTSSFREMESPVPGIVSALLMALGFAAWVWLCVQLAPGIARSIVAILLQK